MTRRRCRASGRRPGGRRVRFRANGRAAERWFPTLAAARALTRYRASPLAVLVFLMWAMWNQAPFEWSRWR